MWRHQLLSSDSIFCCRITKLLTRVAVKKGGSWSEPAPPFSVSWMKIFGWEERAPTEDSIGTAEISAGL